MKDHTCAPELCLRSGRLVWWYFYHVKPCFTSLYHRWMNAHTCSSHSRVFRRSFAGHYSPLLPNNVYKTSINWSSNMREDDTNQGHDKLVLYSLMFSCVYNIENVCVLRAADLPRTLCTKCNLWLEFPVADCSNCVCNFGMKYFWYNMCCREQLLFGGRSFKLSYNFDFVYCRLELCLVQIFFHKCFCCFKLNYQFYEIWFRI